MAKKPPKPSKPAEALNGGRTSFNEDGTFPPVVCMALRLATKNYNATISKIERTTADRDALLLEVQELDAGTKNRQESCEEIVDSMLKLKGLRADRIRYGSVFAKLIEKADKGEVDVALSAKEIINNLDGEDEGGDEDSEPERKPLKFTGHGKAMADAGWRDQWEAYPAVFEGREWPVVHAHIQKIHELRLGNMMVGHPAAFPRWLLGSFKKAATTEDRKNLLPGAPDWFWDGIRQLVAAHATCELAGQGVPEREQQSASMLADLAACADHDVDAWLAVCGGKDSPLNRAINTSAKAVG